MKVGDVRVNDFQADVWQRKYRLVENLGGGRWVTKYLYPDDEVIQRVFDHWANADENTYRTPVWDKTWAECDESKGERPQIVRDMTDEEMLERDLDDLVESAGRRSTIQFVSRERYASYF